jgi:hypothetical protein
MRLTGAQRLCIAVSVGKITNYAEKAEYDIASTLGVGIDVPKPIVYPFAATR